MMFRLGSHLLELRARATVQTVAHDFNPAEMRMCQANHHTTITAVANKQVRAAAEHEKRQFSPGAKLQNRGQILFRRRLNVNVRRAADAQGRASGQRFVVTNQRRA